jgi:hypothetical protein
VQSNPGVERDLSRKCFVLCHAFATRGNPSTSKSLFSRKYRAHVLQQFEPGQITKFTRKNIGFSPVLNAMVGYKIFFVSLVFSVFSERRKKSVMLQI